MLTFNGNLKVHVALEPCNMRNPSPEGHEALLPANWIQARPAACQTIESRVA